MAFQVLAEQTQGLVHQVAAAYLALGEEEQAYQAAYPVEALGMEASDLVDVGA